MHNEKQESPFSTAPKTEWSGQWMWTYGAEAARDVYAFFRRTFAATGGELLIDISADSYYWLYLDGEFIGRGPSRAPLQYYTFDSYHREVAAGSHCLAILGHHIGEINATVMTGRPAVLADIELRANPGSAVILTANNGAALPTQDLSSGPGWRCLPATAWKRELPCMMSHFGFWEECDLRALSADWTSPAFADESWSDPVLLGKPPIPPWTNLCPRDIPLPRYREILTAGVTSAGAWRQTEADDAIPSKTVAARQRSAETVEGTAARSFHLPESPAGRYLVVDFACSVSGFARLEVVGEAGQCLELSYDELLGEDGAVNPERSYAHLTDRFILPGGRCRVQTVHPRGFRYLMIDISGRGSFTLEQVSAVDETYPFELHGAFDSSAPTLQEYYRKSAETVRVCSTDAFTDCATRERVQWMEDLYVHSRVAAYAFGDTRLLRRALFQGAQCALPDGRINGFMPSERTNCAFAGSSIMWLHLLLDYWLFDGNEDISRLLPTAHRLLACIEELCDGEGLLASWPAGQFWDWAPIEGSGCLLLTNAAYAWALTRLAEHSLFHEALGTDLAARAEALRAAAHARFWDQQRQLYRDALPEEGLTPIYSQHANAMAVLGNICPMEEQAALLRRIIDPALLGPTPVGEASLGKGSRPAPDKIVPVGTLWFAQFLCQACFTTGLDKEALCLIDELWGAYDTLPIFPETRIQQGNTFLGHGWAGGPAFLLPAFVLGLRPTAAGWSEIVVDPHPGELTHAAGQLATPRGNISVEWTREDDALSVQLDLPSGTRALLRDGEDGRMVEINESWNGSLEYTNKRL